MQYSRTFTYTLALFLPLLVASGCAKKKNLPKLPASGAQSAAGPRQVRTALAAVSVTSDTVKATGTAMALSMTKVMPLVPGLIIRLPVKEGQQIKKGQILAQQDQRGFKLGLRQAKAAVEMAEVGVSAAKRERDRFEKLLRGGASTQATVDQITDKFLGAAAGLKQARVAVEMGQKALKDSVIRAPYNGIVVKKMVSIGDYATSMPPTVLFILMETHIMELHISLPEPEMGRVEVGLAVTADFTSVGQKVTGKIARIVNNVDPMSRSFIAIVELPNPEMAIKPGLFAQVEVKASAPRRRLLVPKEAVVDEGKGVYSVFTTDGKKASRRVVQVTQGGQDKTEVLSGIAAGVTLILNPAGLTDGQVVVVAGAERAARAAK